MVAVIIFSILFNMPRYLNWHMFRKPNGSLVFEKSYLGDHDVYQLVYFSIFHYIFIYVLPVIILAVMTYRNVILLLPSNLWFCVRT